MNHATKLVDGGAATRNPRDERGARWINGAGDGAFEVELNAGDGLTHTVVEVASAPAPPPVIPPRFNADYLRNPAPAYPPLARRMHEQGRVLIRVLVSADGAPERIELKTSSGFARLDQSALETIRSWKFVPARQGEQTVAAWVVVPITFTLDG